MDVQEALDTDLDAYLDRELFIQPDSVAKPAPVAQKPAELLQGVLAMAAEEEQWLRTQPAAEPPAENSKDLEGEECPIPEHLKAKPAPVVEPVALPQAEIPWTPLPAPLPGLALAPHLAQPGNAPVAPAPVAPSRAPWIVTGALVGAGAASVLLAGMLWVTRETLPDRARAVAAYVPAGTVTAVVPPPATTIPEPVLSVKDSPLPRQPEQSLVDWSAAASDAREVLPGPVVAGRMPPRQEPPPPAPAPASVKAEPLPSREKVQARRAPAMAQQRARRDVEDPLLQDTEEEMPLMQKPVATPAPAPVAKAESVPAPKPKNGEYAEFDEDFARELGFTEDAVRKVPESKGVKSVWIPPDPSGDLPESLTPADIQQVVVANQPAIVSCIRRHKDAIPGLNGGRFTLRWFVHPDGSTSGVIMETQALRGTALATCLEDLAKHWKFPKHRTQMGAPVRFPFTF